MNYAVDYLSIIKGTQFIDLKDDEYVPIDFIRSKFNSGELLIGGGAGIGKSTAVREAALKSAGLTIILLPTIANLEKIEYENKNDKIIFFYSRANGVYSEQINYYKTKIIYATYDAYRNKKLDQLDHQLIIDESHDFIAFRSIKRKVIDYIMMHKPKNTIWLTATPYNLANTFEDKYYFRKKYNKDLKIIEARSILASCKRELLNNKGKKILVYINGNEKIKHMRKFCEENDIKVEVITAKEKGISYINLIKNKKIIVDVILCTKVINIGVDIRNQFDLLIYAANFNINDIMQFSNRDRDAKEYTLIIRKIKESFGHKVNDSYKIYDKIKDLHKDLSVRDQMKLNSYKIEDFFVEHYYVNSRHIQLTKEIIINLFKVTHVNFDTDVDTDKSDIKDVPIKKYLYTDDMSKYLKSWEFFNETKDYYDNKREFMIECGDRAKKKLKFLYKIMDGHLLEDFYEIEELLFVNSSKMIEFDDKKINSVFKKLKNIKLLDDIEIDKIVNFFNKNKLLFDLKEWSKENFVKICENRLGLYFIKKRIRKNGERIHVWENRTIWV